MPSFIANCCAGTFLRGWQLQSANGGLTHAHTYTQALRRANKNTHINASTHSHRWMNFFALFCNLELFCYTLLTNVHMYKYAGMYMHIHTYVFNCFECVLGHFIFKLLVERVSDPRIILSGNSWTQRPNTDPRQVCSLAKMSHVCLNFSPFFFLVFWGEFICVFV